MRRLFDGKELTRRRVLVAGLSLVVAALLVVVGRLERSHEQTAMLHGIDRVRAAIGPSLSRPGPADRVDLPGRRCLLWAVGARIYALELCIDASGRVVEAVDRSGTSSKFYSLVEEPGAARMHIDPVLFNRLVERVRASAG